MAGLFGAFRAEAGFQAERTMRAAANRAAGRLSAEGLRALLEDRDAAGGLEVDAAPFLGPLADDLPGLFPEAAFLVLTRPPGEWAASMGRRIRGGPALRVWERAWLRHVLELPLEGPGEPPVPRGELEPALRRAWQRHEELLARCLPPGRTLWLPLHRLLPEAARVAALAGVPAGELRL